jgi:threonine dehydrogenase-like Zn-dependent dehydrogenase
VIVTVCYIAGPAGHEFEGLVIGMGPVNHPWGPGERGEIRVSQSCRLAVAEVEEKKGLDAGSIADRAWCVTKGGNSVKPSPLAWRLGGGHV